MTRYNGRDFKLTPTGDIDLGKSFAPVESVDGIASLMQTAKVRVMSSDPEVEDVVATDFCANLEDLIGMPNTIETAQLGVEKITRSLTYDGLVSEGDLYIRPTPVNKTMMMFLVFIEHEGNANAYFEVIINFEVGVAIGRESYDAIR